MKIKWLKPKDPQQQGIEITIISQEDDPDLEKLKTALSVFENHLIAKKDGKMYRIPYHEIYYIESQEDKTVVFTAQDSFQIQTRLYEIEQWGDPLLRINKSTIVNWIHIRSFKSLLNSKLEAILQNGDRLEVSRVYLPLIKEKLKGKNL